MRKEAEIDRIFENCGSSSAENISETDYKLLCGEEREFCIGVSKEHDPVDNLVE